MHRRRRLAVGSALVATVTASAWFGLAADGGSGDHAGAASRPPAIALASVEASGVLSTSEPGWRATRVDIGTYELEFPSDVQVALRTWTAIADVTARPVGPGAWLITFHTAPQERVDSAFTFLASPTG